jgi:hypothetical protein
VRLHKLGVEAAGGMELLLALLLSWWSNIYWVPTKYFTGVHIINTQFAQGLKKCKQEWI